MKNKSSDFWIHWLGVLSVEQRKNHEDMLDKFKMDYAQNPVYSIIEIFKLQQTALIDQNAGNLRDALLKLITSARFYYYVGDLVRASITIFKISDLLHTIDQTVLALKSIKYAINTLRFEFKRIWVRDIIGTGILIATSIAIVRKGYSDARKVYRSIMSLLNDKQQGRLRVEDTYRLTRVVLESIRAGDQLEYRRLRDKPANRHDETLTLQDRFNDLALVYNSINQVKEILVRL